MITAQQAKQISEEVRLSRLEKEAAGIISKIACEIESAARDGLRYYLWEHHNMPSLVQQKLNQNGYTVKWQNVQFISSIKSQEEGWLITW